MSLGSIKSLMDALVQLEETIDPRLMVERYRPVKVDPPVLYNWIVPSTSRYPATSGVVQDQIEIAVRVLVETSDLAEQTDAIETYWDLARDKIDADLVYPGQSILAGAGFQAQRTRMRNITDTFNDIGYLGLELIVSIELRRQFQ